MPGAHGAIIAVPTRRSPLSRSIASSGRGALGLGLCGLGRHGNRYAAHLLAGEVAGARLSAVCRRDEAAGRDFASRHGIAYHRDVTGLIADPSVDVVAVVLPPDLHPDVATACLDAGKPVLVDKPLAASSAGARRVVEAAARTGIPVMVGHNLRYNTVMLEMRRRASDLGPLRLAALCQRFEPTDRAWIDTPGRGGVILNTGVHGIDLLRWLTGAELIEVFARAEKTETHATEDSFVATCRLHPAPPLATLDNCRASGARTGRVELVGEHGTLAGDFVLGRLLSITGTRAEPVDLPPPRHTVRYVLQDFVDAVRQGRASPIPAAEGLAAVAAAEALMRAATTGEPCPVDHGR